MIMIIKGKLLKINYLFKQARNVLTVYLRGLDQIFKGRIYFLKIFVNFTEVNHLLKLFSSKVWRKRSFSHSKLLKQQLKFGVAMFIIIGSILLSSITSVVRYSELAKAASGTVRPDGDTTAGWANCTNSCTNHYTEVDETTYDGNDYVSTGTGGTDGDTEQYTMTSAAGSTLNITQVDVKVYSWINGTCQGTGGSNCDTLSINISIDGSTTNSNEGAQTYTLGTTADDNQTFSYTPTTTWTGDDDLEVIAVRNENGGGPAGSKDDDVYMAYVDALVTFDVGIDQEHYRWRDDTTALNTDGGWLAAEDINPPSTSTVIGNILRLRIEIDNFGTAGTATQGYRLEWADKVTSCSAATGWTRADTASDDWEMVASAQYTDGDALSTSRLTGGEPTFVSGEGLESSGDDTSGSIQLDVDDYTEIEWAIRATSNATEGADYCFRAADNTGGTLSNYNVYPEITLYLALTYPIIDQVGYVFENDDSSYLSGPAGPTSPNTGADNSSYGSIVWTNPTNVLSTDDNDTNAALTSATQTHYLEATNFGFSIPQSATINGIEATFEIACTGPGELLNERERIVKGGTIGSTNKTGVWSSCGATDTTQTIGGPSDKWGETWTPSDINSTDFGVVTSIGEEGVSSKNVYIDHIQIKIYYSIPDFSVTAGSEFLSGKTLSDVRKGERINLRMHLDNFGGALESTDELALFYDRNDGIWTKVKNYQPPITTTGNCSDNLFTCTEVDDSVVDTGLYSSLAIDPSGVPWVSYRNETSGSLMVANYVGSNGNCDAVAGSDAWNCTEVDNTQEFIGRSSSIAFDSTGNPWVSYMDGTNTSLKVANFVGSGGNCTSNAWDCTTVDNSDYEGDFTSITFDSSGNAWISYRTVTAGFGLTLANYVGSGGSCDDAAWECTEIINDWGYYTSIAIDPSGNPWVSYWSNSELSVAKYVGSEGNCSGGTWECTEVDDSVAATGYRSSIAIDPSGIPWISYHNDTSGSLMIANYVGSDGNCDEVSGSDAWDCREVDDSAADTGKYTSIAIDSSGKIWISYYNVTSGSLMVSQLNRAGELSISPTSSAVNGDTISESHADMTSATDTTERDDTGNARCISTSTNWNNGLTFEAENGIGLNLPNGELSDEECTEVAWTIDTSQAVEGTTYRFVVATKDNWRSDKGLWRGVNSVATDGYPTLTIAESFETEYRYSKDNTPVFADCTATNWGCLEVDDSVSSTGYTTFMAFDPSGTPWISYRNSTSGSLMVASYVGSGGNCDAVAGSDAWNCTEVDDSVANTGNTPSLAFDQSGKAWVSYGNGTSGSLMVANYVGSNGNCDAVAGSDAWNCTEVDNSAADIGTYSSMAFSPSGKPWVSYHNNTSGSLMVANYVGSNGNCDAVAGSDAWNCTEVDDSEETTGDFTSIAFDQSGQPWISYRSSSSTSLMVANYVGSGGNCDAVAGSDAWNCTEVDNSAITGLHTSIAFDSSNNPWVSFYDATLSEFMVANYVGIDGNCDAVSGSDAWDCTIVDNAATMGRDTSIAFDPSGNPWASYDDQTADSLIVANYVGSGGNCDDVSGSDAWNCTEVDSGVTAASLGTSIAFDPSGRPWVSYRNGTSGSLMVASLDLPPTPLSTDYLYKYKTRNAGSGDLRYHLDSGRAPYDDTAIDCKSDSNKAGYCGLYSDNGDYDSVTTASSDERPIYAMANKHNSNSTLPTLRWIGNTNLAPSTSGTAGDIVMEVYRFGTTNAWENVGTDSSSTDCKTKNCILSGIPSGTASEYFETIDGKYWMYTRIYQVGDGSTSITFKVDQFNAAQTSVNLKYGSFFLEGVKLPLNQRR
jgi:hypothetical protein